jgi:hypothetical protein
MLGVASFTWNPQPCSLAVTLAPYGTYRRRRRARLRGTLRCVCGLELQPQWKLLGVHVLASLRHHSSHLCAPASPPRLFVSLSHQHLLGNIF